MLTHMIYVSPPGLQDRHIHTDGTNSITSTAHMGANFNKLPLQYYDMISRKKISSHWMIFVWVLGISLFKSAEDRSCSIRKSSFNLFSRWDVPDRKSFSQIQCGQLDHQQDQEQSCLHFSINGQMVIGDWLDKMNCSMFYFKTNPLSRSVENIPSPQQKRDCVEVQQTHSLYFTTTKVCRNF